MFKKDENNVPSNGTPISTHERWKMRCHEVLKKISSGAAQIARMIPYARKENWRRTDKFQKTHENHPHKSHRNK